MKGRSHLEGFDELDEILATAGEKARDPLFGAFRDGAQRVENRAKRNIARGKKTGRVYTHRFPYVFGQADPPDSHKRVPHQASAPGEYPAGDTGILAGGIRHGRIDETETTLTIDVESNAEYSVPLELKPPEKGGRPHLGRAADEEVQSIVDDAIARLLAKGLP